MKHDFDFDQAIRSGIKLALTMMFLGAVGVVTAVIGIIVLIAEVLK